MLEGANLACLLISIETYHASIIRKKVCILYTHLQGSTLGDLTIAKLLVLGLKMAAIFSVFL